MRKSAVVLAVAIAGAAFGQLKTPAQNPVKITTGPGIKTQAEPPLESAKRIERDEAIKKVKEGKAIWVDVRGKDQYDLGHIKQAVAEYRAALRLLKEPGPRTAVKGKIKAARSGQS